MAQITEKIIEIKTKVDGEKTVKDLKNEVAELAKLMDTLEAGTDEYRDAVNALVDSEEELNKVMKAGKSQLSAQEGSYNALVNRMAALQKAHKAVTDETTRNNLSKEIDKINNSLKEMDAANGVYVRNVGNYENAFKEALKTPQQELRALREQLAQLEEGTTEYNITFARMAELTHNITEQQEMLKWSSADLGDILANVSGVATSLAGGLSAINAAGGLLGFYDNENIEEAMLTAQRFIQLVQGLEQLEQITDKVKGLWVGIQNFKKAKESAEAVENLAEVTEKVADASATATSATKANTAATNAQTTANTAAATSTTVFAGALGVLKTALITTGIGALVVALGYLANYLIEGVTHLKKWATGELEAEKNTERLTEKVENLNESLSSNDEAWDKTERLMRAQGKIEDEIYSQKSKYLYTQKKMIEYQLKEAESVDETTKSSDEYQEQLKKLRDELDKYDKAIDDLDYDKFIKDTEAATQATKDKKEAIKAAAEEAKKVREEELEQIKTIDKRLDDANKTRIDKLKERFLEEYVLYVKHNKDVTKLKERFNLEYMAITNQQYKSLYDEWIKEDSERYFKYNLDLLNENIGLLSDVQNKAYAAMDKSNVVGETDDFETALKKVNEQLGLELYDIVSLNIQLSIYKDKLENLKKEYQNWQSEQIYYKETREVEQLNAQLDILTLSRQYLYDRYVAENNGYTNINNNAITQMNKRFEMEKFNHYERVMIWEQEKDIYEKLMNDETLSDEVRFKAQQEYTKLHNQLILEQVDFEIAQRKRQKEAIDLYVNTVKDSLDSVAIILQNVADAWQTSIEAQVEAGEISEEEGERRMEQLKGINSAIALINALTSAVNAYQSMSSIPYVGPFLGAAAAAAALAAGLANVAAINKVKKGDNSANANDYANAIPNMTRDYSPQLTQNITGGKETEDLANALSKTKIQVSVTDIDNAQNKVKVRDNETSF